MPIPEDELREVAKQGSKIVDWCLRDGDVAAVFESKATAFNKSALTTGKNDEIESSLKQVFRGCEQCREFILDCSKPSSPYHRVKGATKFFSVVVTRERMPLIDSVPMKELMGPEHGETIVLSIQQLELLQMFSSKGVSLFDSLSLIQENGLIGALKLLYEKTGAIHGASFLHRYDNALYEALGEKVAGAINKH